MSLLRNELKKLFQMCRRSTAKSGFAVVIFALLFSHSEFGFAQQKKGDAGQLQPPSDLPLPIEESNPKNGKTESLKNTDKLNENYSNKPDLVDMNTMETGNQKSKKNKMPVQNQKESAHQELNDLGVKVSPQNKNVEPSKTEALPIEGKPTSEVYQEKKDTYMKPIVTDEGYVYDPVGRRDPFRPYRDSKIGVGNLMGYIKNRQIEPLEKFDAKSLQVVAIIWGTNKPKALVEDPERKIHTVYKGMRIGKNDGVVAEIREGEVVVVEVFDYNGKLTKESFIIPIRK